MATLDHTPSLAQELAAERFKLATELAITGKSPYLNGAAFVAADQPEFGSREEFAQVLVLREVDEFLATVEDAIRARADDPAAALEAAFEAFLTAAAESPLVRAIVSGDGAEELLPLVTTHGGPVLDHDAQPSRPRARQPERDALSPCHAAVSDAQQKRHTIATDANNTRRGAFGAGWLTRR
jgi:AcrR family transcriptional regulator